MALLGEAKELNVAFYAGLSLIIVSVVLQMISYHLSVKNSGKLSE
jgi:hypothetical protein